MFADSSGWVALFDRGDAGHAATARAWQEVKRDRERLLTSALVLAETATHLRRRAGWEASRRAGDAILASGNVDLAVGDRDLLDAAWREFLRNADPKLSLCDALSFVLMRERGVARALTFDRHFADAGFEILPWSGERHAPEPAPVARTRGARERRPR